ncbi:primosomal protein N' [Niveibacterium umoris]|uniref:Replication restart protein PriA n=1 Tax=Niveibacterium umoris TaxID=1193620 RepID=A0A840BRN8_9RHOO|nr:primosomal protein N' [Niveibacterium umoris]MBB4014198.1 primosomal protein N' (replication factor Y) [Niveibacterium umoris]
MKRIVRLALPVPLPRSFDYLAPVDISPDDVGRMARVPFGSGEKIGVILALPDESAVDLARLKPLGPILREVPALPADWIALVQFAARYYHHPLGEAVAVALPPGLRVAALLDDRSADPWLTLTDAGRAALAAPGRMSRVRSLAERLFEADLPRSELVADFGSVAVREARQRGWVIEAHPRRDADLSGAPTLNDEQRSAVDAVWAQAARFSPFLLHGITGSGKTEVYLRLIERALAAGKQALLLVPEIGLTPQLEARVASRFPRARRVALHSGATDGARCRGFIAALDGSADIVIGTRLSVFSPLPRLGLILIDEEHDASYKQQDGLRYSARDLAVWRAQQAGVPVVLGSATPSLETWQAAQNGRYRLLKLERRAAAAAPPTVRLIDTRRIKLKDGLSPPMEAAIAARLERGEQSLIFLNRRGYAPVLACPACNWVSDCDHCSAHRVFHLSERLLRCHHCGTEAPVPRACPQCGNQDLHGFGRGTQRVEEYLGARFPQARILRADRDSIKTPAHWAALRHAIEAGEADILVGTQMLAKGHDFPKLTLVGVIGADASLFAADYRAPERLFQQLMQVGGRAGRAGLAGEVLIQTEFPEHPLFDALRRQDFAGFANSQLDERAQAHFPPCGAQAVLRAEALEVDQAIDFLKRAREAADPFADVVRLYDAVPMRLVRRARLERAQLVVEADTRAALQNLLAQWLPALYALKAPRGLRWHVDVDPIDL